LDGGTIINSGSLAKFLNQSEEVFIIGITAGNEIVEYRDKLIKKEDLFLSVIADATGSEIAEEGANWIHDLLDNSIKKQGLKTTRLRYSPGYGDFKLSYQRKIFDLLQMERLNLKLTDNFLIIPEKSITAIIGIVSSI
jgi:cobalamin-dependent methionine synthase I